MADSACVDRLLNQRGKQILGLLGMGLTNEEIGAVLGLSEKTAEVLRHRLLTQLGRVGSTEPAAPAVEPDYARVYLETYYGPTVQCSPRDTGFSPGLSDQWSAVLSRPSTTGPFTG